MTNLYDDIIKAECKQWFPELFDMYGDKGWLLIKAQAYQESRLNPEAVSPVGAIGIMQIMPETAKELGINPHDPQDNIGGGIAYLGDQFEKLPELYESDRLCAALASYNGGRGYINKAMALGRDICGQPYSYGTWDNLGRPRGAWQNWNVISRLLESPSCSVRGKTPDYKQMQNYVTHIMDYFASLVITEE